MKKPTVSVVMCVHNGQETVKEAVDSIINQSFGDFEFIIINDGSTDDTLKILGHFCDQEPRIRLFTQKNAGLTRSLNIAASMAEGIYVARQDADDISYPLRLEKQIQFMESNPNVDLLGTNCYIDDGKNQIVGKYFNYTEICNNVYLHNPFAHSSAMFRLDKFKSLGGYNETFDTSQDFELWMRFAEKGPIAMLPDPLVVRRQLHSVISRRRRHRQYVNGFRARMMHPRSGMLRALLACVYQLTSDLVPKPVVRLKRRLWP